MKTATINIPLKCIILQEGNNVIYYNKKYRITGYGTTLEEAKNSFIKKIEELLPAPTTSLIEMQKALDDLNENLFIPNQIKKNQIIP